MIFSQIRAQAMPQKPGIQGMYEQIELAARTCYKSEKKIEYDEEGNSLTAADFVDKIVKVRKHTSVAEHGAVYLIYKRPHGSDDGFPIKYIHNKYSEVRTVEGEVNTYYYITTNYRVLVENKWEDDLKYWHEPTEHHALRRSVRFFTDRGVSAESNRHRVNSPSERSTRYVNYGNEGHISVIVPVDFTEHAMMQTFDKWGGSVKMFDNMCMSIFDGSYITEMGVIDTWLFGNMAAEFSYMRLLELGWKPQEARRVLPMDIETELVVSAYEHDWARYFCQRYFGTTGTPHPDMELTAAAIMNEFAAQGWDEPLNKAIELNAEHKKLG